MKTYIIATMSLAASLTVVVVAQDTPGSMTPVAGIFREVAERNELMTNLEHLSDAIGPRLTGSDGLQRAATWAMKVFDQSHMDDAPRGVAYRSRVGTGRR